MSAPSAARRNLKGPARELRELLEAPVLWARHLRALRINLPKGVLLSGPPGVGKTRSVRLACLHRDTRVRLQLFSVTGADLFSSSAVGGAEALLRAVFRRARKHAASREDAVSCIFIDEIDVVCPKRDQSQRAETVRVVSQLLTLMDGVNGNGKSRTDKDAMAERRLIVLAATNRPNVLDPALRRPGRFDREIRFAPPDAAERLDILRTLISPRAAPIAPAEATTTTAAPAAARLISLLVKLISSYPAASIASAPYHVVPPSTVVNTSTSVSPLAGASGAVAPAQSTLAGYVIV